ncbi:serine/threonine-protein kinase mos-like isoform X2 [Photinus pyralis]|uniref:serine/threonine-protein kinase mos-like isoform X2 n=1 Tax=Photinus pyralis TaxID=7054 RepID=UPI0012675AA0|nr:serine/threonine-protein kinase mos-like isoform X2 [Photinus pyralis]XP_031357222.1 serine/threonine-protein kinase mos-like isoform X2 [Photinus pyralis]
MSTPIRRALFSKVISPLSKSPNEPIGTVKNRPISARYLNFEGSPKCKKLKPPSLAQEVNDVCIKVPSCKKLLINTPNKDHLLLSGISSPKNVNVLGKGAFGTVVSGVYKGRVAVKVVKLRTHQDGELREKNALGLNHKNVIKIIDVICKANTNYGVVLMEYLGRCRHLQDILDDRAVSLSSATVIKYGLDICAGLHYCHSNNVLHLDLKPANVLLCDGDICKLCDFGNSQRVDCSNEDFCLGTILYAAPELLMGRVPTAKCDIYSFGVLLWQMRYREIPYSNLHGNEVVVYKVVKFHQRPKAAEEDATGTVDEYRAIYTNCWSADPKDRPTTLETAERLNKLSADRFNFE